MTNVPTIYRVAIKLEGSTFTVGQSADPDSNTLWFTSFRDPTRNNYITTTPSDDGDKLDVLTSNVEEGACKIGVSDASEYVTNRLTNTSGRPQLVGSAAYCELSTDDGTSWDLVRHGFITDVELPRAQEFLFTIGGTRRRERNTPVSRILSGLTLPHPVFRPTAIIGGPIWGGIPSKQQDFGLPKFTVMAVYTGAFPPEATYVRLRYQSGPMPPDYGQNRPTLPFRGRRLTGPSSSAASLPMHEAVNAMASNYFDETGFSAATVDTFVTLRGRFPGINVLVYDASLALVQEGLTVQAQDAFGPFFGQQRAFMNSTNDIYVTGFSSLPSVSDVFSLAAVPVLLTDEFPLWYCGHPVVVADGALAAIGAGLNAPSIVATMDSLGQSLYTIGRLADPSQTVSDWLNQEGSFWGYALVPGDDSTEFAITPTRDFATVGAVTIDNDDLRSIGGPTFALKGNSRRNRFRFRVTHFAPWHAEMDVPRPYSDLVPFEVPFEFPDDDIDDEPDQVVELTLPGTIATRCHLNNTPPAVIQAHDFLEPLARRLFNSNGKGRAEYVVRVAGHSPPSDYPLGSLLTIDTTHIPNALLAQSPTSQRGGPRPARIIERTTDPAGDDLRCIDEGDGVAYAGTFDIDSFVVGPTPDSARVTISGGVQLGTDGAIVTIYLSHMPAGTTAAPTDNGVPILYLNGDGVNDLTFDDIGPLPTGVIWWIRADAYVEGGGVSASTAWWNLNGTGSPPAPPTPTGNISALVVSDIGTDYAVLTWTNTNATENIRVSYKLGSASVYTIVVVMPPGAVSHTIFGLVPATAYDFRVEMISPSTSAVWTTLTASDTTDAGTPTLVLYTPLNPRAYAGSGLSLGIVGLLVQPVFNTVHEVEFEMTPETAVGSGIPDAWPSDVSPAVGSETQYWPVTSATPGSFGSVDVYSAHNVPNDGRLRFFRARARKIQSDGSIIVSPWTGTYSVMPWTVVVPPPPAGALIDEGDSASTEIDLIDDGDVFSVESGPPLDGGSASSIP